MEYLIIIAILYFVPTVIALLRRHRTMQVLLVNLFFGWSVIGWIIALIMAFGSDKATNVTVVQTVEQNMTNDKEKK